MQSGRKEHFFSVLSSTGQTKRPNQSKHQIKLRKYCISFVLLFILLSFNLIQLLNKYPFLTHSHTRDSSMEFASTSTSTSTNEEPKKTESESKSEPSDSTTNIEWLRQRGVQIDIPSSRQSPSHSPNPQLDREVTIVKIPANVKLAYEEVIITVNDGIPGDQLITLLKPNFVGTGTENISNSALEKATESLLQSTPTATNGSTDPVSILDKTPEVQKSTLLNMFQNQGHVEAFNLTRPSESNKWKSVAIYLDEGGQLKGLPRNSRAESIAAQCGYEGVSLAGDVYVARRFQEGAIRHVSFGLDELSSTADWISSAHRDNYALGAANGQVITVDLNGYIV